MIEGVTITVRSSQQDPPSDHDTYPGPAASEGDGRGCFWTAAGRRLLPGGHNVRVILARRGFRRLLSIRLLAQIADGLFQAGLAGSVLFNPQRAASPAAVAAGFAVLLLPYSLIGPYVGVLLDRWSRRTVMAASNLLRVLLLVPTVVLIWYGSQGALFMTLTLLIIGLNRFFLAALSAATPHVVDDRRLVTANAFSGTLGALGFSVGLGGVALLVRLGLPPNFHGYAAAAAIAPLGYAGAAVLARRSFGATELGPDTGPRRHTRIVAATVEVGRGMVDGVRHLSRRRVAAYALISQSAHRALYGVLALATLLMYRDAFTEDHDLRGSISGIGGAFLAGGVGMLVAAVVTPAIARRIGGWRWIVILLGVAGVTVAVFALPATPAVLPLAVGWVSAASQGTKIVVDTALQHECDDDYRGRVFSVNDTLFNLCFVAGTYLGALALPVSGRSPGVLVAVTFGYLVVAVWYAVAGSRADRAAQAASRAAREAHRARAARGLALARKA